MEKKSATRLDIARRAGTSVSVVSRALNNSGYVAKEKEGADSENRGRAELCAESGGNITAEKEDQADPFLLQKCGQRF